MIANAAGFGASFAVAAKIMRRVIFAFLSGKDVGASSLRTILGRWAFALAFVIDVAFTIAIRERRAMGVAFVHDVDNFVVVESGSSIIANG